MTALDTTPLSPDAADLIDPPIEDSLVDSAHDPSGIAELVRQVHTGQRSIDELPVELRRRCVDHLTQEGFSGEEIAGLLRISARTVRRDRAATRRDHALPPDLALGDELMGEFQRLTLASIQRLTRLTREEAAPPYARLWAEEAIVRCYQRLINTAAKHHYFPTGRARLNHQRDTDPAERERQEESIKALLGLTANV